MAEIAISTRQRDELVDITAMVERLVPAELENGVCLLFCRHTTAGLTVNENADPDVKHDVLTKLDRLIPATESYYRHGEGNSAAHLKASLMGPALTLPVRHGRLALGTWQGIYFCEFDGPRSRRVEVMFQAGLEI